MYLYKKQKREFKKMSTKLYYTYKEISKNVTENIKYYTIFPVVMVESACYNRNIN